MAQSIAEQLSISNVTKFAFEEIDDAEQLLEQTKLSSMNTVADALCESGPIADIQPFLLAMHGLRATYGGDRHEWQVQYEDLESQFNLGQSTFPFTQVLQWHQKPSRVYAYSYDAFDIYMRNRASGTFRQEFSALQYKTRKSYGYYIGKLLVPSYGIDFRNLSPDSEVREDTYLVATVRRHESSIESDKAEIRSTQFGGDIADWAKGHHPKYRAEAFGEVALAQELLIAAMPARM